MKRPFLIFNLLRALISVSEKIKRKLIFYITEYIGENSQEVKKYYYSSGTIKIFTDNHFYKVGFFSKNINIEFKNYLLIKKKYILLGNFLPGIIFFRYLLLNFIKIKKYSLIPYPESINFGIEILNCLKKYGKKKKCNISSFKNINRGIFLCGILYGNAFSKKLKACIEDIFSEPWMIGPVHGDFHLENMLYRDDGKPLIIDLEDFTEENLQALDAFNFLIDCRKKKTGQKWQDTIKSLISSDLVDDFDSLFVAFLDHDVNRVSILYILNKLGNDNEYYGFLSKSIYSEFYLIKKFIY